MNIRERNLAVWRFLLLPFAFLTVALLGGLRVGAEKQNFIFVPPPLVCLILAALLMLLFLRGRLLRFGEWLSHDFPLLTNIANALTLTALFFASAQALNSVLPESGLLFWLFSFFFLWTLWNNLFSEFDARRLLRSLMVLFGTAFLLKHLILAAFTAPEQSIWRRIANLILEGVSLGSIDVPQFAPATGYISFFALAVYVLALVSLPYSSDEKTIENENVRRITGEIARLTPGEIELLNEEMTQKNPKSKEIILTSDSRTETLD